MAERQEEISGAFLRGLITEANDLTFPNDASEDELNCELDTRGWRERRPGIELGANAIFTRSETNYKTEASNSFTWFSPSGALGVNFEVIQNGSIIYFYDHADADPSPKAFTIDLSVYQTFPQQQLDRVDFASSKGFLFIAGRYIDPIYVSYNQSGDSITVTQLDIQIRDLIGLEETGEVDDRPATLSSTHRYNLYNQGWNSMTVLQGSQSGKKTPIDWWDDFNSDYPSNADIWYLFKSINAPGRYNFDTSVESSVPHFGNSPAPKGHFIVSPFQLDRSSVSGIVGLPTSPNTLLRPTTIEAYAGRIWYSGVPIDGLTNSIWFSQILVNEDASRADRCYQENDPTAEELNSVLATDGGSITISGAGNIISLFEMEAGLVVFANNGIWLITGPDGFFQATDFIVRKISGIGIENRNSVINASGTPYWWDSEGIKTIVPDQSGFNFVVQNISERTIQTFYEDISVLAKSNVMGSYDAFSKRVLWVYNEGLADNSMQTRGLVLDVVNQVFMPWEFKVTNETGAGPFVVLVTAIPVLSSANNNMEVQDRFRLLCFEAPSGGNVTARIGTFTDKTTWLDYGTTSYSSYLMSGPLKADELLRLKTPLFVYTMFNQLDDSSCLLSSRWDYSINGTSGKFGTKFQAYRQLRENVSQVIARHKIRGSGRAVRLRFENGSPTENFQLTGWALVFNTNRQYG